MKRSLAAVVAAATFVVLTGTASGGTLPENQYEGRIQADPNTYIGFDIKKANGVRRVRKIRAVVPAHCHAGFGGHAYTKVSGSLNVKKNGRFKGALSSDFEGSPFRFRISGRVRGKNASGKLSTRGVYEEPAAARGSETTICYTGVLRWRARRGAEVNLPLKRGVR